MISHSLYGLSIHKDMLFADIAFLGLYGQVNKCIRWMPRRQEAMKDVVACEKLRGGGKQPLIRRYPNGETRPFLMVTPY